MEAGRPAPTDVAIQSSHAHPAGSIGGRQADSDRRQPIPTTCTIIKIYIFLSIRVVAAKKRP